MNRSVMENPVRSLSVLMSALLFAGGAIALAQDDAAMPAEGGAPADAPAEPAAPAVQTFKVDGAKSVIFATTKKTGVAAGLAHDHVIRATQTSGDISYSATDASKNSISVTVDVNSMAIDRTADRKIAGLEGEVSNGDQESVKKNMLSEGQLNGAKFTTVSFKSSSITPAGSDKYTVEGDLTIRGVTQKVSFPAKVTVEADSFHGTGSIAITHTQFGFEPYSAAFGAIANSDAIKLSLDIWGKR